MKPVPRTLAQFAATRRPKEKAVQQRVIKTYEAYGAQVYSLSQPRATMQTEGIPDLWVFLPKTGVAWWHETKRPKGRQSPEQVRFQELSRECGIGYVLGGVDEAIAHLQSLGLKVYAVGAP